MVNFFLIWKIVEKEVSVKGNWLWSSSVNGKPSDCGSDDVGSIPSELPSSRHIQQSYIQKLKEIKTHIILIIPFIHVYMVVSSI